MQEWYRRIQKWFSVDSSITDSDIDSGERMTLADAEEAAVGMMAESGDPQALDAKMLVSMVMSTKSDEIDCDEFFAQMDRFVELDLAGEDMAALMPLVQDHAERCRDCREEYEALRRALEAVG